MKIILSLLLLTMPAFAQQSPRYGVPYNCDEMCNLTDKKIERWAKQQPKRYRDEFKFQMIRLRSFPAWLDSIHDDVMAEFKACGLNPDLSPINVHVETAPFQVQGYPANSQFSGTVNQAGQMRIVYWHVASFGPQNAVDLYRWE